MIKSLDPCTTVHETVYRSLRAKIMIGEILPGVSFTIRGIAKDFGVSMTPVREATRRLVAEGALTMSSSGRINSPLLNNERIEELVCIRSLLEPELAVRALPRVHGVLIERLSSVNSFIEQMIVKQNTVGYLQRNIEFHKTLYLRAQAPAMLALLETVWLQSGPTMRSLYDQRLQDQLVSSHREILQALKGGNEVTLANSIRADLTESLRMLLN